MKEGECSMEKVMEIVEAFIDAYMIACRIPLRPESLCVDGNLSVCLDKDIPIEQKYRMYVVIILEEGRSVKAEDYIIEVPIVPTDEHFAEFRQCFMDMFEVMVGNSRHWWKISAGADCIDWKRMI